MIRHTILIASVGVVLLAGCSHSTSPGSSGNGHMLAYGGIDLRIYLTNVEGTQQEQVAPFQAIMPKFSPNGDVLAAITFTGYLNRDSLILWNLNTKVRRNIASIRESSTSTVMQYAWSPDGSKIVFVRSEDLCLVNAQTGEIIQLTNQYRNRYPAWSADSKTIWFVRYFSGGNGDSTDTYLIDADGKNLHTSPYRVTNRLTALITWRPDNNMVAFAGAIPNGTVGQGFDIYVTSTHGGIPQPLTNDGRSSTPDWSPDGTRIAFTLSDGTAHSNLFVMNSDGTGRRAITSHNNIMSYQVHRWSPDGKKIAYLYSTDMQNPTSLHVVDVDDLTDQDAGAMVAIDFDWKPNN